MFVCVCIYVCVCMRDSLYVSSPGQRHSMTDTIYSKLCWSGVGKKSSNDRTKSSKLTKDEEEEYKCVNNNKGIREVIDTISGRN